MLLVGAAGGRWKEREGELVMSPSPSPLNPHSHVTFFSPHPFTHIAQSTSPDISSVFFHHCVRFAMFMFCRRLASPPPQIAVASIRSRLWTCQVHSVDLVFPHVFPMCLFFSRAALYLLRPKLPLTGPQSGLDRSTVWTCSRFHVLCWEMVCGEWAV